jgi:hypothetical protein
MNSLKIMSLWMALGGLTTFVLAQDSIVINGQELKVGPGQKVVVEGGKVIVTPKAPDAKDANAAAEKPADPVLSLMIKPAAEADAVPVSWIGIITSPVPPALQSQLGLEEGTGIVVDFVAPDAPAKDLLKVHDIICKFDGQTVSDPDQFRKSIQEKKPGTEVTLLIRRQGKEQTVKVKLGARPPEQGLGIISLSPQMSMPELPPQLIQPRLHSGTVPQANTRTMRHFSASTVVVESDGEHTYSLKTVDGTDGKTVFTVTGKDGKTEFQGPVNTDAEKAKIPKEFQERFNKLQDSRKNIQIMRENFEMQAAPVPGLPVDHLRLIEEQRKEMERIQEQMEIQRQELKRIQEQMLKNAQPPAGK